METGLYYLQTRYYDPEFGRFISPDNYFDIDSLNGLNLYVYCLNNPVSRIDTNGNSWWDITTWDWAAIGRGAFSTLMIVGGIALCTVPGLQMIGAGLIVAGSGGLIGGFIGTAYNGDFNSGWDYGTIIGGSIGLMMAVPQLLGVTTSMTLPTFGWLSTTAGSVVFGVTGSIAVTIPVGAIASGIAASGLVYLAYQRKPAAPRIHSNSRKKAYDKAFHKGGKKKPILHMNGPHGPHYHPANPKFKHWHYYFSLLSMLGHGSDCECFICNMLR